MKKLLLFGLGVIASMSVLTSCKKDEVLPAGPTVTFANGSTYTAKEADTAYTFVALIEAAGELKEIKLFDVSDATKETQIGTAITKFDSDTKQTLNYTINLVGKTGDVKVKVSVTDKKDQTNSYVFTLTTYKAPVVLSEINTYTATLLGGQSNSAVGSYYASSTNKVYKSVDAANNSALIDFIYYYGSKNKATLVAPDNITVNGGVGNLTLATVLNTQNATRFGASTLSAVEFDAITKDADLNSLTTFDTDIENTLSVGSVFAFKTASGKKGLIKVNNITGLDAGSITITVKVQK